MIVDRGARAIASQEFRIKNQLKPLTSQTKPPRRTSQAIRNRAKPAHLRTSAFFSGWFGNNQKPENPDHEQGKL